MTSPLQEFKDKNKERWQVLQDMPAWEVDTVISWLKNVFVYINTTSIYANERFNYNIVRTIESDNRLLLPNDLKIDPNSWADMSRSLNVLLTSGKTDLFILFLECVIKYVRDGSDTILYYKNIHRSEEVLIHLELSLEKGSRWRVVFEKNAEAGLVERVDPRLTEVAKELDINYLTKAWNEAFSVTPKPDKAIENAQRAIESVASEKGLTTVKTGVYGNLLGDIKSNPGMYISAAKAAYDLSEELSKDPKLPVNLNDQFSNWFWEGMELIQKSNPARHASDKTKDFVLGPEAGKQAVLMATVICQLISSGYFIKRSKPVEARNGKQKP